MRILHIERGGDELLQGFVRAEWPQRAGIVGGKAASWIRMFLRSASLWSMAKPVSAAVRIAIEPGRPVTTVHSFVVERRNEPQLRLVLAAFMRTDQMGAGHTEGPQDDEELAGRFLHGDEPRIAIVREALQTANGLAIHHNIRLSDQLPRLLQNFTDLAIPFAYELQAMAWTTPREPLRQFLHNLARLTAMPGIPPQLARDQAALGERIKGASFNIEECISIPAPEFTDAVHDTLTSLLGDTLYSRYDATPRVELLSADRALAFANHVHSGVMLNDAENADLTAAARREDVDRCLSCLPLGFTPAGTPPPEPEPLVLALGPSGPSDPNPPSSTGGLMQTPAEPRGPIRPFLFISYARVDGERVYPIIDQLAGIGTAIWIDRHLIGGDDWVAELETQLVHCSGILAFVSTSFIASKNCGREIRFGDALNKKIVPVFLEQVALSGGLGFLLHATQRVMLQHRKDPGDILSAIKTHIPTVYSAAAD